MPKIKAKNRNYENGANFERRVKKWFIENGYRADRTAGSHGQSDVIARNGQMVWEVQCKLNMKQSKAEEMVIQLTNDYIAEFPEIAYPVIIMVAVGFIKGQPSGATRLLKPGDADASNKAASTKTKA